MISDTLPRRRDERATASGSLFADILAGLVEIGRAGLVFAVLTGLFFVLVVALFKVGLFSGIAILFYRGIAIIALSAGLFTVGLVVVSRRYGIGTLRDVVAATLVASSLTLTFHTLVPVTIDRSITIFINGHMAAAPDRAFSVAEIDQAFRDRYLTGMDQIARRMEEQRITGTVERVGQGYRITDKGKALIANSRTFAAWFAADTRLLDGPRR